MDHVSDSVIAASYFAIPISLLYFCTKSPVRDKTTQLILTLFISFIMLCGFTHLFSVLELTLVNRICKILTAVVSVTTALTLVRVIPEFLLMLVQSEQYVVNLDRRCTFLTNWKVFAQSMQVCAQSISSDKDAFEVAVDILRRMFPSSKFELGSPRTAVGSRTALRVHENKVILVESETYDDNRQFFDDVAQHMVVAYGYNIA